MNTKTDKTVAKNARVYHDYFIDEVYECGIVLTGTEIKSIRNGKVTLQDSFCYIKNNEIFISGMNISKYEKGNIFNHNPKSLRKLLMHKNEIIKLYHKIQKDGYTIVPTKVYLTNGLAKIEIALARGKKLYDKREDLKKKTQEKEIKKY